MPTNHSLDLVIHVSTDRRDGAALALAGSRRQTDEAQRKLEILSRYLHEYMARMNDGSEAGSTDPVRIANTRAFIDKLEHAIEQQQCEIASCESRSDVCFQLLNANERKLKSLETLRDRRATEAWRADKRREQKRTDEFGASAARNGGATLDYRPA
jgi:flagellar export protein FliJ